MAPVLDHSELGPPLNGFRYKFLEPPEYEGALKLVLKYLLPALAPIGCDPNKPNDWKKLFERMMKRGTNLSYIAVHEETGDIASVRMIDLVEKDVESDLNVMVPSYFKDKPSIDSFKLCADLFKDINLFEMYNIKKYVDMFGLVTDEKYRKRGLAVEMYRRGLNYLQNRGIEIVKVSFISPFSRKAGHKNGYIELVRREFRDCKDEDGKILCPNADPTNFIDCGVYDLRNRKLQ